LLANIDLDPKKYALRQARPSPQVARFHSMKNLVSEYYPRVDRGDLDWVLAMFANDAVYTRADSCYEGKNEISEFYCADRKINGRHTINTIMESGNTVAVQGVFKGQGADGSPKNVRFSDFWQFDRNLVSSRNTYLALGSNYVKD